MSVNRENFFSQSWGILSFRQFLHKGPKSWEWYSTWTAKQVDAIFRGQQESIGHYQPLLCPASRFEIRGTRTLSFAREWYRCRMAGLVQPGTYEKEKRRNSTLPSTVKFILIKMGRPRVPRFGRNEVVVYIVSNKQLNICSPIYTVRKYSHTKTTK